VIARNEWSKLDRSQVQNEIEIRRKLILEMVGTLYPAILQTEIEDLTQLLTHKGTTLPERGQERDS
jgi:hypothetical protein